MEPQIIKEPNEILHQKSDRVIDFREAEEIAKILLAAIRKLSKFWNRWLGLAANQMGYLRRIIVLRMGSNDYLIMVNPEVLEVRCPFPYCERCRSVRGLYIVKRYLWARVRYQDLDGKWNEIVLKGPSAIYQEIDHLNGLLVSEIGFRIL